MNQRHISRLVIILNQALRFHYVRHHARTLGIKAGLFRNVHEYMEVVSAIQTIADAQGTDADVSHTELPEDHILMALADYCGIYHYSFDGLTVTTELNLVPAMGCLMPGVIANGMRLGICDLLPELQHLLFNEESKHGYYGRLGKLWLNGDLDAAIDKAKVDYWSRDHDEDDDNGPIPSWPVADIKFSELISYMMMTMPNTDSIKSSFFQLESLAAYKAQELNVEAYLTAVADAANKNPLTKAYEPEELEAAVIANAHKLEGGKPFFDRDTVVKAWHNATLIKDAIKDTPGVEKHLITKITSFQGGVVLSQEAIATFYKCNIPQSRQYQGMQYYLFFMLKNSIEITELPGHELRHRIGKALKGLMGDDAFEDEHRELIYIATLLSGDHRTSFPVEIYTALLDMFGQDYIDPSQVVVKPQ